MMWILLHPQMTMGHLGFVPGFLNEEDPRSAREQIDANYGHGGGWHHFEGFKLLPSGNLFYPGDPQVRRLAMTKLRDETIYFYEHSWLMIMQPDGQWEISRID